MSKNSVPLLAIPIICMLLLIFLRVGTSGHYASPSHPRITSILITDPAIIEFSKFAAERKLRWSVDTDTLGGTMYCASLMSDKTYDYRNACDYTISAATQRAIDNWNSGQLTVKGGGQP